MDELFAIGQAQHGLVTLDQARRCGLSRDALFRLTKAGVLVPVHEEVFRFAGAPKTWEQRVKAATLAGGEPVAASHATALALWDVAGMKPGRIEVTVPYGHDYNATGVAAHRSRRFEDVDWETRWKIPVTTPTRTLIDIAARTRPGRLYEIADDMFLRGLSSPLRVLDALDRIRGRGRSGTRLIRAVIDDYLPGAPVPRSVFERRFYRELELAGLWLPERRAMIETRLGLIEVDFLWRPERFVVETDGRRYHDQLLAVESDSERRRALTAAGLSVMTVRWVALRFRPEIVMHDVRTALFARRVRQVA